MKGVLDVVKEIESGAQVNRAKRMLVRLRRRMIY